MITIRNNSVAVQVIKAYQLDNINLFPGYNNIDMDEGMLEKYKSGKAAKGMFKEHLTVIRTETLTPEEKIQADAAKAKSEKLNTAKKTITAQNRKLAKNDKTIEEQKTTIDVQLKRIDDLMKRIEDLESKNKSGKNR